MRMWWWREVRLARISRVDRDLFERYGETVIGTVLSGGLNPATPELRTILPSDGNPGKLGEARDWLTECRDTHEQKENRLETVEWAILFFVIVAVVVDLCLLFHQPQ
jgi:hypothetical protein